MARLDEMAAWVRSVFTRSPQQRMSPAIVKTLVYRVRMVVITIGVAYLVTGSAGEARSIGTAANVSKTGRGRVRAALGPDPWGCVRARRPGGQATRSERRRSGPDRFERHDGRKRVVLCHNCTLSGVHGSSRFERSRRRRVSTERLGGLAAAVRLGGSPFQPTTLRYQGWTSRITTC